MVEEDYPVFGNGAGRARRRTVKERLYCCRVTSEASVSGEADKEELFDAEGKSRGFYSIRNRLNDLTGREWVYWSKSVINQSYPPDLQHKLRSSHGGQKPPRLCEDLIRIFTKSGQLVLDPFAGVGGTLLGASLAGRDAVGIEIDPDHTATYHEVCRAEGLAPQRMISGDSHTELERLEGEGLAADFVLTDVPYWNMDKARRSAGSYKRTGQASRGPVESKLREFRGTRYESKEQWLEQLGAIFRGTIPLLQCGGYLAVFIGDMYHSGRYHFLSADLAALLESLGLTMKANLVWYDVSKSLHVYGYLYQFIPSMIHQNILVFRRES